jgi:hypothetical protein
MDAPEPDALAIGLDQVAVLDANEAVFAGGSSVKERDVAGGPCRGSMIDHIRLKQVIVPGNLGAAWGRDHREGGKGEPKEHLAAILVRIGWGKKPA